MNRFYKSGFSIVELVIVVAVIGMISFLGYTYVSKQQANVADTATRTVEVPTTPAITTTADLTTAEKALDDTAIDNTSDSSQLDAELVNF